MFNDAIIIIIKRRRRKRRRNPAVARKADRTVYDVRYCHIMLNNQTAEIYTSGIVKVTRLPMAIP